MANNYCETSSFLPIPVELKDEARAIAFRVDQELRDDPESECCDIVWEIEDDGIWFHGDESANVEHMEQIARAVIEELELDKPFYASWAYTCSKPRIDEFGGGALVIRRGRPTFWIDAVRACQQHVEDNP